MAAPAVMLERPAQPTDGLRLPKAPRRRKRISSQVIIHILLASYCLTSVAAFFWYLITSLKTNEEFLTKSPWSLPARLNFGNFIEAFHNAGVGSFILNSLYVTVLSVAIGIGVSTMAAYALARVEFIGRSLLIGLLLVGMLMPAFGSMIPLYFLLRNLHLLGSLNGLVLVYVANQIPLSIYILRGFYAALPVELEEAAYLDGASASRTFFSIVLPQTYPVTLSLVVLNSLTIWNEFVLALVLLPNQGKQTIAIGLLGLSVQAQYSGDWVQLFAGLIIASVPMLVLFIVAQDRIARGIAFGGLKG